MMEIKSTNDGCESIYQCKAADTSVDEELKSNLSASRKNEALASCESGVSHLPGFGASHDRSKHQFSESEPKNLSDFHSPKELEEIHENNKGERAVEHKYEKDESLASPHILGGDGGGECNGIHTSEPIQNSKKNRVKFHNVDPNVQGSPVGHLEMEGSDHVEIETCSISKTNSPPPIGQDKQEFGNTTISIIKEEHFREVNDFVDTGNCVMKEGNCLEMPIPENGGSVKEGNDVRKVSGSPTRVEAGKQHLENIIMPSADEVPDLCEVNELENNVDFEMKDGQNLEIPISSNVGITNRSFDAQKVPRSLGRLMFVSPQRGVGNEPPLQENTSPARVDGRGSPCGHNSPRHGEPCHTSLPTRVIISPKWGYRQESSQMVGSPKDEHHFVLTSSPTEDYQMADSPRKADQQRDSPSGMPNYKEESLRGSHRKADYDKHLSKSPRRLISPRSSGRSISRSPTRRRDSPRQRRGDRDRSCSRSPYARERHRRSPRRRHSPHHKSPPSCSHSHRRSPRRRPSSSSSHRASGVGRPGRNLFIAGFSFSTTERDLERKFSRFGRVTDVRVVRNPRTGDSRGFGFLSLERDEEADAAIRSLDQTEWNGRIILVEKSNSATR